MMQIQDSGSSNKSANNSLLTLNSGRQAGGGQVEDQDQDQNQVAGLDIVTQAAKPQEIAQDFNGLDGLMGQNGSVNSVI